MAAKITKVDEVHDEFSKRSMFCRGVRGSKRRALIDLLLRAYLRQEVEVSEGRSRGLRKACRPVDELYRSLVV